jgi:hypothetical protein
MPRARGRIWSLEEWTALRETLGTQTQLTTAEAEELGRRLGRQANIVKAMATRLPGLDRIRARRERGELAEPPPLPPGQHLMSLPNPHRQGEQRAWAVEVRATTTAWLCCFATPQPGTRRRRGTGEANHHAARSVLVTRWRSGCWQCSCEEADCGYVAAAQELWRQGQEDQTSACTQQTTG